VRWTAIVVRIAMSRMVMTNAEHSSASAAQRLRSGATVRSVRVTVMPVISSSPFCLGGCPTPGCPPSSPEAGTMDRAGLGAPSVWKCRPDRDPKFIANAPTDAGGLLRPLVRPARLSGRSPTGRAEAGVAGTAGYASGLRPRKATSRSLELASGDTATGAANRG